MRCGRVHVIQALATPQAGFISASYKTTPLGMPPDTSIREDTHWFLPFVIPVHGIHTFPHYHLSRPTLQVLLPTLVCVAHGNGHICDSLAPHLSRRWLLHATEQSHNADLRAREQPAAPSTATTAAAGASSHQSPSRSAIATAAVRRPALLLDRVCSLMGAGAADNSSGSNSCGGGNSSRGRIPVSAGRPAGEEEADSALPQLLGYTSLSIRFPVDLLPEARSFFLQHCCLQKVSSSVRHRIYA